MEEEDIRDALRLYETYILKKKGGQRIRAQLVQKTRTRLRFVVVDAYPTD